jgi:hypothetical protein
MAFLAAVIFRDCKSVAVAAVVVDMCFSFQMFVKHRQLCDQPIGLDNPAGLVSRGFGRTPVDHQ